jgi:hypothetical protein
VDLALALDPETELGHLVDLALALANLGLPDTSDQALEVQSSVLEESLLEELGFQALEQASVNPLDLSVIQVN